MHKIFVLLFVFLIFASSYSAQYFSPSENELTDITEWEVSFDDSIWAHKNIVGIWKETGDGHGIRWYRSKIFISEIVSFTENLAILIPAAISAYEIYWDGIKIGGSGQIGIDEKSEVVGNSAGIFVIPYENASVGEHILSIKISNFSTISGVVEENPKIGFLERIIFSSSRQISISFLLVGVIFITALFNIIFIAKSLNIKAHITYAVLSLCFCGHILIFVFLSKFPTNLQNYYSLALIGDVFWIGILSLLPIYLFQLFDYKHIQTKSAIIVSITTFIVALPRLAIYDIIPINSIDILEKTNSLFALASVILSIIITFDATKKKKKGAKTILMGVLLFAIGVLGTTMLRSANGWSIGFAYLSCFITIVMGRFFWDEMRKKNTAEVKNARLELELLKNNIQPHFLLNSLNSIVAWIEEDPKTATKLVGELAKELRLLMAFSEKKTISLMEEISLCEAHIQVMNLRKEKKIKLEILDGIEGISVPPLVLHTALENGITHGFIKKDNGTFTLKIEKTAKKIKIILENDGDNKISQNKKEIGTGNKYIIQRLNENYGKNFKFESQPKTDGWQVIYEIPRSEK